LEASSSKINIQKKNCCAVGVTTTLVLPKAIHGPSGLTMGEDSVESSIQAAAFNPICRIPADFYWAGRLKAQLIRESSHTQDSADSILMCILSTVCSFLI
jgi:hypothetical protein